MLICSGLRVYIRDTHQCLSTAIAVQTCRFFNMIMKRKLVFKNILTGFFKQLSGIGRYLYGKLKLQKID
jgi:hypothetical protein